MFHRVPTRQRKWPNINPCQGKHREFGQDTGNLVCSIWIFLNFGSSMLRNLPEITEIDTVLCFKPTS